MRTQAEKAAAFRRLHERPGAFVIPNPWDPSDPAPEADSADS
jgi:2-methylisocitrate lyase-like PEP mutase family enzyme